MEEQQQPPELPKPQTRLQREWAAVASEEAPGTPTPVRQVRRQFSRVLRRAKTGVLSSAQARGALRQEIQFEEEELRQCFAAIDDDQNGWLDLAELEVVYREAGVDCGRDDLYRLLRRARKLERDRAKNATGRDGVSPRKAATGEHGKAGGRPSKERLDEQVRQSAAVCPGKSGNI
eukprot:scaffold22634_cov25-Prasinocladus_malaysianus.AAC.3